VSQESARIAAALAAAAEVINAPRSLDEVLDAISQAAQEAVPGFNHVGVSIMRPGGKIETLSGTDQLVWELDALQYELDEGPCVDAIRGNLEPVVIVKQARHDQRWPTYMPRAVEAGLRAQLAVRLYAEDKTYGGLNLYSTEREEIEPEAREIAQLFATHAAIALGWARHDEQLNEALSTRKIIGQALGIIMERYQIDEDRAFHFLTRASSTSNIKLRTIAQEVVDDTGSRYQQALGDH
jgi:GAF domain-containing protein